jgi:hypothetical protein
MRFVNELPVRRTRSPFNLTTGNAPGEPEPIFASRSPVRTKQPTLESFPNSASEYHPGLLPGESAGIVW